MAHYLTHAGNFSVQCGDAGFLCLVRRACPQSAKRAERHHHDLTFDDGLVGRFSPAELQNRVHADGYLECPESSALTPIESGVIR